MDPEVLEMLRRSVDLRLDAEGRWYHEGRPFEHARLTALFDRGLDVHEDTGEAIVRIGDRWCYVQAEDTPFVVRRLDAAAEGGGVVAELNTGERLPLPEDALETADGQVIYAVLGPRRRARLGRALWHTLTDAVVELPEGGAGLSLAGRVWPIRAV